MMHRLHRHVMCSPQTVIVPTWAAATPRWPRHPDVPAPTTKKRPSHAPAGIGRFIQLYSGDGLFREMATRGASLSLSIQRSHCELLAVGSPGPAGLYPGQSRLAHPQDEVPLHCLCIGNLPTGTWLNPSWAILMKGRLRVKG